MSAQFRQQTMCKIDESIDVETHAFTESTTESLSRLLTRIDQQSNEHLIRTQRLQLIKDFFQDFLPHRIVHIPTT